MFKTTVEGQAKDITAAKVQRVVESLRSHFNSGEWAQEARDLSLVHEVLVSVSVRFRTILMQKNDEIWLKAARRAPVF